MYDMRDLYTRYFTRDFRNLEEALEVEKRASAGDDRAQLHLLNLYSRKERIDGSVYDTLKTVPAERVEHYADSFPDAPKEHSYFRYIGGTASAHLERTLAGNGILRNPWFPREGNKIRAFASSGELVLPEATIAYFEKNEDKRARSFEYPHFSFEHPYFRGGNYFLRPYLAYAAEGVTLEPMTFYRPEGLLGENEVNKFAAVAKKGLARAARMLSETRPSSSGRSMRQAARKKSSATINAVMSTHSSNRRQTGIELPSPGAPVRFLVCA
jgi:hypothetical protein